MGDFIHWSQQKSYRNQPLSVKTTNATPPSPKGKAFSDKFEFIWRLHANGQSPHLITFKSVPEVRGLPSYRHYATSTVICPSPTPARIRTCCFCCGSRPRTRDGSPTLPKLPFRHAVPNTPLDQDRWAGYVPVLLRPSPNIGRVGIHDFPFGACSGFTRVTACQIAAALSAYIFPQGFSRTVSQSHCLGSYRDEPTISRAELSSAGNLRPRGAPIFFGWVNKIIALAAK